ncbi:hypothetical protein SAMN05216189_103937 [Pseudomonas delhiensis]|uniref:Uncharacterized protein n=1 Tax=Pseudomonas delhiensis TaxID=366289 RepID=A0A239N2U0_9PSED|nr:hypothetical protein [Pseudomonas delhiensis]SDK47519.1 hypothetical protein SAMN05216189_103937 [Pseudomonas delhiensis]SNT48793.1 hypothetical protein SAMN06295949_13518 [Pseudomonas delhiensis]
MSIPAYPALIGEHAELLPLARDQAGELLAAAADGEPRSLPAAI